MYPPLKKMFAGVIKPRFKCNDCGMKKKSAKKYSFFNPMLSSKANLFFALLVYWACTVFPGELKAQTTLVTQTGNMDALRDVNNVGSSYAGTYNNSATELANYANQNSGSNTTPGAAAFRTFTTNQAATGGAARPLRPGDRFLITAFAATPATSGVIGISFKNNTTYTNVASYTNGQVCRFELTDAGNWTIVHGGGTINTGQTSGADRVLQLDILSSNSFNATIGGTTFFNLSFINAGPVASFCIYNIVTVAAVNRSNPNSLWKNASLQGRPIVFGGTTPTNVTGNITNGGGENTTALSATNVSFTGTSTTSLSPSSGNTYSGTTTLSSGTLQLGASEVLPNTAINISNNATLSTGATTGFTETLGLLTMTNSATLSLGSNSHILTFANSSGAAWSGTLTITGWGVAGAGQVFFGNSSAGLTALQLSNINFAGYGTGAKILATGEIQPAYFYISAQDGNYNTGATWIGGLVPPAGAAVYINNGHTVTLDVDALVSGFTVAASATFNATNGSPRTLTLSSNTNSALSVNGTWSSNGSSSTVVFTAPGPANVVHAVSGTVAFDHVNIGRTGAGTHTIGVSFSGTSTVNGNLTINVGGFVQTLSPPNYGTSSTLVYNTGNAYTRSGEWTPGALSGPGYPNDVILGSSANNSSLTVGNEVLHMRGNFTFAVAGSALTVAGGRINIGKSWINNGTTPNFTAGTGTIAFTGTGNETIGGTNTNAGGYAFYDLGINKSGGGSVTLSRAITVANTLSVDGNGIFILNGFNLTVTSIYGTVTAAIIRNNTAINITLTITNGNSNTFAGAIQNGSTGTISIFKSGAGTQGFSGTNTYSGTTTVANGTLSIGSVSSGNGLSPNSNYIFNTTAGVGLSFANMPAGSVLNAGTLNIQVNTTITLNGPNNYTINFQPSDGVAWNLAATVTVMNWTPSANRILNVGSTTGLTYPPAFPNPNNQVSRINFDNYGVGAKLVGIEVRPAFLYVTEASGSGNYTTAASWLLGDRPVLNNGTESIYIQPGFTLNMDVFAPTVRVLRCEVGGNVIMNAGDSIIIFPTGDFRITGTVSMTATSVINMSAGISLIAQSATASFSPAGILNFDGAFTITSEVPNAVYLPNVNLRAAVNFGLNSYIQNGSTLNMLTGGFVSTNPPYYMAGSTLAFRTGGNYGRNLEWSATSGRGYPHHVLVTNSTNLNMGAWGGFNVARQCGGDLTIDPGSILRMDAGGESMNAPVTVLGNVNVNGQLRLGGLAGGDFKIGGNYIFSVGGSVINNGRCVFFIGTSGNQTVTRTGGGNVFFNYVELDKSAGNLLFSGAPNLTNGYIISNTADTNRHVLTIRNGDIDLNDGIFTLEGNATNSINIALRSGKQTRIFTSTGVGDFRLFTSSPGIQYARFNVDRFVANSQLLFDNNVTVSTNVGCDFGPSGISIINSILRIDQNGFIIDNSPDYGPNSVLIYNNGGAGYKRNREWTTNAGSVGYPHDVIVQNSTLLELNSSDFPAPGALGCSGKFSIEQGSQVTTAAMPYTLSVGDSLNIRGSLTLSTNSAGDLFVGRSWNRSSTGVFVQNDRMVTFNGSNAGAIRAAGGQIFSRMTIDKTTNGSAMAIDSVVTITNELFLQRGTVTLNNEVVIQSTATQTARIGQTTTPANLTLVYSGIGKFQIQRYLPLNTNTAARRWRLLTAPLSSNNAPTINAAWQEGQVSTNRLSPVNNTPGFGTAITRSATAANGYDQGITSNPSIQRYNPTSNAWEAIPATNTGAITDERGYMLFVRGDRSIVITGTNVNGTPTTLRVKGEINVGSLNIPLNASGFQIIGNPFASAITFNNVNFNGVNPGTTANRTFYLWDPKTAGASGVGKFISFTSTSSGTYTITGTDGSSSAYSNTGIIESGAAFMIPVAGGTFGIGENTKLNSNSTIGLASRPLSGQAQSRPLQSFLANLYWVSSGETRFLEGVRLLAREDFSNEVDFEDAPKPTGMSSFDPLAIVRESKRLSVETRRPPRHRDTLYYQIGALPAGTYRFDFIPENLQRPIRPVLVDRFAGTETVLSATDTSRISFTVSSDAASRAADRFFVVFRSQVVVKQFSARVTDRQEVQLQLSTQHEWEVDHHVIERATDTLLEAIALSSFSSSEGAAESLRTYAYTDAYPGPGVYYYRVKSKLRGGEVVYTAWEKVTVVHNRAQLYVYPNPVTDGQIRLQLNRRPAAPYSYRLFSADGRVLQTGVWAHPGGSAAEVIRLQQRLASGTCILEVRSGQQPPEQLQVIIP